jgi:4-amino-4-deoxy-L-arabinose transferase-like glycosyltransferase
VLEVEKAQEHGFPDAWVGALALIWVLALTFLVKLHNLDHTGFTRWDEVYHAIVARNVYKHPLQPTLVDVPYLEFDHTKWGENHVWLHKPIVPFWQVALSFALLGINTLALRLPAALLSTGAAWLTYLIGAELFERRTALIAALLQAINPFIVRLVHGYQFADTVDVALLFWVEASIYFLVHSLRTGRWRDVLLAGAAQGVAFLCKSYLAAIVFGVALTAWLLPIFRLARRGECRLSFVQLMALPAATLVVIAPWLLYCATYFPAEFEHEHAQIWRHLHTNVENWAAPWDRVVFDYLIAIHGVFYTPTLVALLALSIEAVWRRHVGLWLCYAWASGVVLPHLFAVTKTPSATLLALPAGLLLLGRLVAEATRLQRWPLGVLAGIMAMSLLFPAVVRPPGHGFPQSGALGVMRQAMWVGEHVAGALLIGGWLTVLAALLPVRWARISSWLALAFCIVALTWLAGKTALTAWRVTETDTNDRSAVEIGTYVDENLPANAVLFFEAWRGDEHLATMFYSGRTCYALPVRQLDDAAHQVSAAGGIPHLVTRRRLPLPLVHTSREGSMHIYRLRP